ncbi:DUF2474 domain-containing protein [Novosphingobium sp. 11B]
MKQDTTDPQEPRLPARLAWFAGIWLASVLALTIVAFALRAILST